MARGYKRQSHEAAVQRAVCQYMDASPWYRGFWFHTPNERSLRNEAFVLSGHGVKAGIPDVLVVRPSGRFVGLALELKREKAPPSALSTAQRQWLRTLFACGWYTCVGRGIDEAIEHLTIYADPLRHPDDLPEI